MDFYREVLKAGGYYFSFTGDEDTKEFIESQKISKIGKGRTVNYVRMDKTGISYKQYTRKGVFDASHDDIANDINFRLSKKSKQKAMLVIGILLLISSIGQAYGLSAEYFTDNVINDDTVITLCIFTVSIIAGILLTIGSQKYKMPLLVYDITPERQKTIQDFYDRISRLQESEKTWIVKGKDKHDDGRRHAGATADVSLEPVHFGNTFINGVKSNVYIPAIYSRVYFLPDVMLFVKNGIFKTASYGDIEIKLTSTQFRENGEIPSDSEKIGSTWKYVNNDGSPDKRFKDNYKIPILKYCGIKITDNKEFYLSLMVSHYETGEKFANALRENYGTSL